VAPYQASHDKGDSTMIIIDAIIKGELIIVLLFLAGALWKYIISGRD
jgi:hypothetical protein